MLNYFANISLGHNPASSITSMKKIEQCEHALLVAKLKATKKFAKCELHMEQL